MSNTIYGMKFAMKKNDFERLKSSSGKKRNDFVANPIVKLFIFVFWESNLLIAIIISNWLFFAQQNLLFEFSRLLMSLSRMLPFSSSKRNSYSFSISSNIFFLKSFLLQIDFVSLFCIPQHFHYLYFESWCCLRLTEIWTFYHYFWNHINKLT